MMVQPGGVYTTACQRDLRPMQFDGGVYTGCVVAIAPLAGAQDAQCIVHALRGTFP
jgi:hypothetical protein